MTCLTGWKDGQPNPASTPPGSISRQRSSVKCRCFVKPPASCQRLFNVDTHSCGLPPTSALVPPYKADAKMPMPRDHRVATYSKWRLNKSLLNFSIRADSAACAGARSSPTLVNHLADQCIPGQGVWSRIGLRHGAGLKGSIRCPRANRTPNDLDILISQVLRQQIALDFALPAR